MRRSRHSRGIRSTKSAALKANVLRPDNSMEATVSLAHGLGAVFCAARVAIDRVSTGTSEGAERYIGHPST